MKFKNYFIIYLIFYFLLNIYLIQFTSQNYYWDEVVYLQLAKNLNQQESYNAYIKEEFRPILLPVILSFLNNNLIHHLIIILISTSFLFAAYNFLKYFFEEKIVFLSVILISVLQLYLFWSSKIMPETLSMLLITLTLIFYLKFKKTNKEIYIYLSIFISSLSVLSKPLNLAFTTPFLLFILIENRKLITKLKFFKAFIAFLIPLIPLFIQGSIFYNNPLGSLIYQSKVTINPSDYFFYIKNFFKIFSFTSPFIIFGLINYKKLKFFLIIFIVNIFILQLIFSHNVQERFMLSLFPLILPFIASGIDYITKKIKYSSLIIFIIALLILPSSINSIINDPASTKLLIESTKELKDLPQGKMFCNSVPYCSFFGNKEVFIGNEVHKISFPPNKNEFLFILKNESIKYIFLDNYHLEPKYKDFIENNFKLLFHHQNAYKYTKLFLAN